MQCLLVLLEAMHDRRVIECRDFAIIYMLIESQTSFGALIIQNFNVFAVFNVILWLF